MRLEKLISEMFNVVLMVSGMNSHGKNLMTQKILIRIIIAQVSMILMLINIKPNVEHHYDFGRIKAGLILYILMVGFRSNLDIG